VTLVNPIQHPGAIVRGLWSREPCQETYLRRLKELTDGKRELPDIDISKPPPRSNLFPTIADLWKFSEQFVGGGGYDAVSVDIENAGPHIICVGFTQLYLSDGTVGRTICLRFRQRGGGLYWKTRRALLEVVEWMYIFLGCDSVAKIFHNGVVYDVPILSALGFEVKGRLIDTLNLAHACYPELSKGLQFTATLYNWAPCWKRLTEEGDEGDGKA